MITSEGIYSIPMAEYLADPVETPSLTASVANALLNKSPAHARLMHPRLYAGFERQDESRFELGSAAHALLLENDGSAIEFIAANDWRTNAAKEARDAARAAGKLPVLNKYEGTLRKMVEVARDALAQSEFNGVVCDAEQTVVWQDGMNKTAWCRCRPDWWSKDRKLVIDYKTSDSAEPGFAIRQLDRMGYSTAGAFYLRGMAPHGAEQYVWLFQEIEPPFACSLIALGNAYRAIADEKVDRAIAQWQICMANDKWPAYDLRLHYAEPTSWQMAEYEARMNRDA